MKKVYSKIESITGNVITVRAEDIRYGDLAEIDTVYGTSLAEVIRLREDLVSLQVFAGGRGVSTGDTIRFLGHPMRVSFSDNLLGRVFTGSGDPRDKGPALRETSSPSEDLGKSLQENYTSADDPNRYSHDRPV